MNDSIYGAVSTSCKWHYFVMHVSWVHLSATKHIVPTILGVSFNHPKAKILFFYVLSFLCLWQAATHPKHPPTRLALQHFDTTYSAQLGHLWPSVRIALLSERKYGALINNFSHDAVLTELLAKGCRDFVSDTDAEGKCASVPPASVVNLVGNALCIQVLILKIRNCISWEILSYFMQEFNCGELNLNFRVFQFSIFFNVCAAQPCLEQESEVGVERETCDVPVRKSDGASQKLSPIQLSPNIKCVVFPRGDITRFKPARWSYLICWTKTNNICVTCHKHECSDSLFSFALLRPDVYRLLGYYLLDAASVLPCLALDVQEGHSVLDLCAAPGGKTLTLLQTQAISKWTVFTYEFCSLSSVSLACSLWVINSSLFVWKGFSVQMMPHFLGHCDWERSYKAMSRKSFWRARTSTSPPLMAPGGGKSNQTVLTE